MMLHNLRYLTPRAIKYLDKSGYPWNIIRNQTTKPLEIQNDTRQQSKNESATSDMTHIKNEMSDISPAIPRIVPMVLHNKEPIVLPFDEVPGPKSLKYLAIFRNYITDIGTQVTAALLTFGLNVGTLVANKKPMRNFSTLFEKYGPVVRFVSPVGSDIVLINHPDHIQKVFSLEGDYPIRSTLESLEKYRVEHKNHIFAGLYTSHGHDWVRQRTVTNDPLKTVVLRHTQGIYDICDKFTQTVYNIRNYQDEISKELYKELHKWAFDCIGLIVFSKDFKLLETDLMHSQCDGSWLYHSLDKATDAIIQCESGVHFWKFFTTPAWYSLVKYCDNLDCLIGKYVLDIEQDIAEKAQEEKNINPNSLVSAILLSEDKFKPEDVATILMDMMLIGVNSITSTIAFLLYNIAKHQKCQRLLYQEVGSLYKDNIAEDIENFKNNTPYLQACIRETLRLHNPLLDI